jgi:ElaB/YqjD/DUF883 family membrane-anchored ribosome-binding protein
MKPSESTDSLASSLHPEKIKDAASDLAEHAAEFIRKHPLESVGGALVAGLLIGLWINRK